MMSCWRSGVLALTLLAIAASGQGVRASDDKDDDKKAPANVIVHFGAPQPKASPAAVTHFPMGGASWALWCCDTRRRALLALGSTTRNTPNACPGGPEDGVRAGPGRVRRHVRRPCSAVSSPVRPARGQRFRQRPASGS